MFIKLDNISIHYKWINFKKEGPIILFLHEGLGSIGQWKNYPELLCEATGLTGLVYDRQGYGKSSALTENRDESYLEKYALEELPAFIENVALGRELILYGHSDGGTIALIYASKYPGQVKTIVTEAAHIFVESITWQGILPVIEEFKKKEKLYNALTKYHGDKTEQTFYAWADTWKLKNENHWSVAHYLSDCKINLLAIQGKEDEYATKDHLIEIQNNYAGNSIGVFVDNCQHHPYLQQQEFVLKITSQFIPKQC